MAFRRKSTKKAPKRRPPMRRRAAFATRVKKVMQNYSDRKRSEVSYTNEEVDWTGRLHNLVAIGEGVTDLTRVGRQIQPHSIVWNLGFKNADTGPLFVTILIVRDRQQVGDNAPTATEILSGNGTINAPQGLVNASNRGRFKILKRIQSYAIENGGGFSGWSTRGSLRLDTKHNVRYNGANSTDIERNGLYFLMITDADPANDSVAVQGHIRLWYTDM